MRTLKTSIVVLLVLTAGVWASAAELRGKVVGVADGDTITVLDGDKVQHRVRLEGIDAPEKKQAYGSKSGDALAAKVHKKDVRIEWEKKDRYDRILGHVYLGDRWINKEMVTGGWAWHFKRYSSDKDLAAAEEKARAAGLGLWADKEPVPPWDYRASKQKSGKQRK